MKTTHIKDLPIADFNKLLDEFLKVKHDRESKDNGKDKNVNPNPGDYHIIDGKHILSSSFTWTVNDTRTNNQNLIPKRIIFNNKTTICFWQDGTKTKVTCAEDETFIPEVGVAMATIKKIYGSRSKFLNLVDKAYVQPSK